MLHEGCIAEVLSLTTPKDVCRLSVVSTTFHSAAESDTVWDKFLPSDIISQIQYSPSMNKSKKDLYLWLSNNNILIHQNTKSFSLEKGSGKRCYMLSARSMTIVWGDTPEYWTWTSRPDSRFGEVAELIDVCWLEIRGKININLLSPNTTYTALLVYKLTEESHGFEYKPIEVSVGVGGDSNMGSRFLDPHTGSRRAPLRQFIPTPGFRPLTFVSRENVEVMEGENNEALYPKVRGDGWMEIGLGEYFNSIINNNDDGLEEDNNRELEMILMEVKSGNWKSGLIVQGIEIRPKFDELS